LACLSYAEFEEYIIEHSTAEDHEEMWNIVAISTDSDSKDEVIERLTAENAEYEAKIKPQNSYRRNYIISGITAAIEM
jgi:hypothetical protein